VLRWESKRKCRNGRAGRQPVLGTLERLEGRELLAFTPLGYSLPDLTVSGYTSTAAAWGGPMTVTLNVRNLGASTFPEPTAMAPGAVSRADSVPTTVAVILSRGPHVTFGNSFTAANITVPAVTQNNLTRLTQTITLPAQPSGFPGDGGKLYVSFKINPTGTVSEADYTNNFSRSSHPVLIEAPLPELVVTGFDVPPVMQPGDTIAPTIRVSNLGPGSTGSQGPLTVALVASTNKQFTSGSSIIATYTVANIPGSAAVSTGSQIFGDTNLNPQANTVTINGAPVTLPVSPTVYFIGVVVDPNHTIKQISGIGGVTTSSNSLSLPQQVGPPIKNLPPAGVLYAGGGASNLPFPYPPNVTLSGTTTTTPQTGVRTS
jgi:hypothetical protein